MKEKGIKWLASLLIVVLITGLFPVGGLNVVKADEASSVDQLFDGGLGTKNAPYLIKTSEQFSNIREVHTEGLHFKLIDDISINEFYDQSWTMIGDVDSDASQLVLDGNGHAITVSGMTVSNLETLFYALGAQSKVFNLTLYLYETIFSDTVYAPLAIKNGGEITNVHVKGYVENPDVNLMTMGDFAGLVIENEATGVIARSSVSAQKYTIYGNVEIETAGFVLYNDGLIMSSYVDISNFETQNASLIGGFVGRNTGEIRDSYAYTNMFLNNYDEVGSKFVIGGFVRENTNGTIIRSYFEGELMYFHTSSYESIDVGAFVGINRGLVQQSFVNGRYDIYEFANNSYDDPVMLVGGFAAQNKDAGEIVESYSRLEWVQIYKESEEGELVNSGFVADNSGEVSDSYYKTNTQFMQDEAAVGLDYMDGFSNPDLLVNWDFDNVWEIRDDMPLYKPVAGELLIDRPVLSMNLGNLQQFRPRVMNARAPFGYIDKQINWEVEFYGEDDPAILLLPDHMVLVGPEASTDRFILRASVAEDLDVYQEIEIKVVYPEVLGFEINKEHTTLDAAQGVARGGNYTFAVNVLAVGGMDISYTVDSSNPESVIVSLDPSGDFYHVSIHEEAETTTYSLHVTSLGDLTKEYTFDFNVVEPYREIVGLQQNGILIQGNSADHLAYGDQKYELVLISHGAIGESTPLYRVGIMQDEELVPINGVSFADNKIIMDNIDEVLSAYQQIYLIAFIEEEPTLQEKIALNLSTIRLTMSQWNDPGHRIHRFGENKEERVSFVLESPSGAPASLDYSIEADFGIGIINSYQNGHFLVRYFMDDVLPVGDYSITIRTTDPSLTYTLPVYVREDFVESIALQDGANKLFIPRNMSNNWDDFYYPVELEMREGLEDIYVSLLDYRGDYYLDGELLTDTGSLPTISLEQEGDLIRIQVGNNYGKSISNDVVYDIELLSPFDNDAIEFQVVYGEIDIEIEGISEEEPNLYMFRGETMALPLTTVKSILELTEGFIAPQKVSWEIDGFASTTDFTINDDTITAARNTMYSSYNLKVTAQGGFSKMVPLKFTTVTNIVASESNLQIVPGTFADLEVKVLTEHENFYSTSEFTHNEIDGIEYVDGRVYVDEDVKPGTYTLTFTSTRDEALSKNVSVQVGGPTTAEVSPNPIALMPGESAVIDTEFTGQGEFEQVGTWDLGGVEGLDILKLTEGNYRLTVGESTAPGDYTITFSHGEYSSVSTDLEVKVYDITDITNVEEEYHINQRGTLTLEPNLVTANVEPAEIEGLYALRYEIDAENMFTIDENGVVTVNDNAEPGTYELTIISEHKPSMKRVVDLHVTAIDSVKVSFPEDSPLAYQAGEEIALSAAVEVTGEVSAEVIWSSSNEDMLTVNELGLVVIHSEAEAGTYTITATSTVDDDKFDSVQIEVGEVRGIAVEQDAIYLLAGESAALAASAVVIGQLSTEVAWESNDEAISVTEQGNLTVASNAEAGTYSVTVMSAINKDINEDIIVEVFVIDEITITEIPSIYKGNAHQLDYTVELTGESGERAVQNVSWSVTDEEGEDVSGISVDEENVLLVSDSVSGGIYKLTATSELDSSVAITVDLSITSIDAVEINTLSQTVLQEGDSLTLSAVVTKVGEVSEGLAWTVNGPSESVKLTEQGDDIVLTVDSGATTGSYTITATSAVDDEQYDTVTVEVAKVTDLSVSDTRVAILPGGSSIITGSALVDGNLSTEVTWSSDDEEAGITVVNGTISVSSSTASGTYAVTVSSVANPEVSEQIAVQVYRMLGFELSKDEFKLNQGQSEAFIYSVQKENGDDVEGIDEVTFSSTNNNIYVNESGEVVVGEDVAAGSYTLTIQSLLDPTTKRDVAVHVTSVDEITVTPQVLNLYRGGKAKVTVDVAVSGEVSEGFVWESSSDSITVVTTEGEEGANELTIEVANNAPYTTHKVKFASEVDSRRFVEVDVKVMTRPSTNTDLGQLPTEPEPTEPEPTEPEPTEAVPSASNVFREDLMNSEELATVISERLADASEPAFTDMDGHWADDAVTIAAKIGITNGYEDGSFRPNGLITRAEFVKMLSNTFPLQSSEETKGFEDIEGHWAKEEIERLASLGVISGYGNGQFAPNQTITREEMVLIITRLLSMSNLTKDTTKGQFNDLNAVSSYAQKAVVEAAQAGLINGKANHTFAPKAEATRAEALTIILNMLSLDSELAKLLK